MLPTSYGFWRSTGGRYTCISQPLEPSAALIVVRETKSLLDRGVEVPLPDGLTSDPIRDAIRTLGSYNEVRVISPQHAWRLAQLGQELLRINGQDQFLQLHEKLAIEHLINIAPQ